MNHWHIIDAFILGGLATAVLGAITFFAIVAVTNYIQNRDNDE